MMHGSHNIRASLSHRKRKVVQVGFMLSEQDYCRISRQKRSPPSDTTLAAIPLHLRGDPGDQAPSLPLSRSYLFNHGLKSFQNK